METTKGGHPRFFDCKKAEHFKLDCKSFPKVVNKANNRHESGHQLRRGKREIFGCKMKTCEENVKHLILVQKLSCVVKPPKKGHL